MAGGSMTSIRITIREDDKAKDLIGFLSDIDFLEIQVEEHTGIADTESVESLKKICGLWKDRSVTLESIRKNAWGRGVQ